MLVGTRGSLRREIEELFYEDFSHTIYLQNVFLVSVGVVYVCQKIVSRERENRVGRSENKRDKLFFSFHANETKFPTTRLRNLLLCAELLLSSLETHLIRGQLNMERAPINPNLLSSQEDGGNVWHIV